MAITLILIEDNFFFMFWKAISYIYIYIHVRTYVYNTHTHEYIWFIKIKRIDNSWNIICTFTVSVLVTANFFFFFLNNYGQDTCYLLASMPHAQMNRINIEYKSIFPQLYFTLLVKCVSPSTLELYIYIYTHTHRKCFKFISRNMYIYI